ncbi:predicted protein [Nematostella vectensis]|uniref:TNF receptor-associated factor n=1 Tax=Nematostella vectensis TaxID=45351 RepID=A7RRA4_NEMVE|nr:predicted protein [Nematostella vectensis]|eukprot:XP_001637978.1 predicted protein [Nematostella vectensis]
MPGYEVRFVVPLDKSFECPVCLMALRDPVQVTPCGHRVCQTCIKPIIRNRRPRCPLDNLTLNVGKIFPDNACHRQILSMDILCPHHGDGCEWQGTISDLEKHLERGCNLSEVRCPKDCGASVERGKLEGHYPECSRRLVNCTHCNKEVVFADMNVHLQSCASFPISCPLTCGAKDLTKEALAVHLNQECPLLVIPCRFAEAGCTFKAKRQKMAAHVQESLTSHVAMLCDLVCEQKLQISAQKERLLLQKEHIQLQIVECRSRCANGEFIWKIQCFSRKLMDAKTGRASEPMISEAFYTSPHGYKMCAGVWLNGIGTGRGRYISVGLQVQSGEFDSILKWPLYPRYTFTLLDQSEDTKTKRDVVATFEPQSISRPSADRQLGKGARRFVLQDEVCGTTYCKDNTIFIKFSVSLKPAPSGFFKV